VTAPAAAPALPLSVLLREGTAAAHAGAESSPFLTALVQGRLTVEAVAALLARLQPVYAALEVAAERWLGDPHVGPLVVPGLARSARLSLDVTVDLAVPAARTDSPAAAAYAARVREVSGERAGFVAHHYTRYLGDLSGGQVMRAAVERSLGLADGTGASFFSFPALRPGTVKAAYRAALDALPLDDAERSALLDEALHAYRLNVALAAELDALLATDPARWTLPGDAP
jgi:heme oxygenase (biliverdin-producing, ferredoxin)